MTEQPTPEEENVLGAMTDAINHGGIPVVMIPYAGPAPEGEFYLSLMRDMLNTSGAATGCITFGTTDGTSGMCPLVDLDPQEGLSLMLVMRQSGMLGPVAWVALASDSYRRMFEPGEVDIDKIQRGDIEQMAKVGDAKVEEVLMVACCEPDGPGYNLAQPYRRTEAGIEYAEVETMPADAGGGVMTLMQELVTA